MRRFILLLVTAFVALGLWVLSRQSAAPTAPAGTAATVPPAPVTASAPAARPTTATAAVAATSRPAPATAATPTAKPDVPIQDGKTIDFSTGSPVVKDDPESQAAIAKAVAAMDAAAADVSFKPTSTTAASPSPAK